MTDFDRLADAAYHRTDGVAPTRKDQTAVWQALFQMDHWLFIVDATKLSAQPAPFAGYIDEQPWLFVFTDSQRALDFAKKFELTDQNGECLYITMVPQAALTFLESVHGKVQGIRVNEGSHGFFAPLANVKAIYDYLASQS